MAKKVQPPCIGLFGTCGGSKWRDPFMATYEQLGIPCFNPQVEEWDPALADIEREHLATDKIILFPVTSETSGLGSLSEVGFSIIQALLNPFGRDFVIMIDDTMDGAELFPGEAKASSRSRRLVKAHLEQVMSQIKPPNVIIASDLDEMLKKSLELYASRC